MLLNLGSAAALGFAAILSTPVAANAAPKVKSVSATVENLISAYGATNAAKLARTEKGKARRARSRKRFDFWAAVHSQIGGDADDGRA